MKRLINRVLRGWAGHPALSGLNREGVRERMANDIVNSMREKSTGNAWFLDLSAKELRKTINPEDR
jgi:hypothetical protein